ncbi:MAG: ribbon-helix-helix protein, CopG family [Labilithrix sp.]|nr:ribbon-helix-helix protein, CopG family [Labilithrix sp.]
MAPPPLERSERLNVRVAPEESAMLDALAQEAGLSMSDIVRVLIRDAYRAKFGERKPKMR